MGSTRSRLSRLSAEAAGLATASDLAVAACFLRMFQAIAPKPHPITRNGTMGSPGKTESTTSTPLERNSGWGLPNNCF